MKRLFDVCELYGSSINDNADIPSLPPEMWRRILCYLESPRDYARATTLNRMIHKTCGGTVALIGTILDHPRWSLPQGARSVYPLQQVMDADRLGWLSYWPLDVLWEWARFRHLFLSERGLERSHVFCALAGGFARSLVLRRCKAAHSTLNSAYDTIDLFFDDRFQPHAWAMREQVFPPAQVPNCSTIDGPVDKEVHLRMGLRDIRLQFLFKAMGVIDAHWFNERVVDKVLFDFDNTACQFAIGEYWWDWTRATFYTTPLAVYTLFTGRAFELPGASADTDKLTLLRDLALDSSPSLSQSQAIVPPLWPSPFKARVMRLAQLLQRNEPLQSVVMRLLREARVYERTAKYEALGYTVTRNTRRGRTQLSYVQRRERHGILLHIANCLYSSRATNRYSSQWLRGQGNRLALIDGLGLSETAWYDDTR